MAWQERVGQRSILFVTMASYVAGIDFSIGKLGFLFPSLRHPESGRPLPRVNSATAHLPAFPNLFPTFSHFSICNFWCAHK